MNEVMMAAMLIDKKGFVKYTQVAYPPPPTYLVPIPKSYNEYVWFGREQNISSKEKLSCIIFEQEKIENNVAIYKEK